MSKSTHEQYASDLAEALAAPRGCLADLSGAAARPTRAAPTPGDLDDGTRRDGAARPTRGQGCTRPVP